MEMSEYSLMLLIESVWAVSARRAFSDGYDIGTSQQLRLRHAQTPEAALAHAEDVHNAAFVLLKDEAVRRLDAARTRAQALYDGASDVTSHGRSQRYALRMVLEALQTDPAIDPVGELAKLTHDHAR